jgi:hypothetical protein
MRLGDSGWTTGAPCPPGMYRPGALYDCRPMSDPGVVQQQAVLPNVGIQQYATDAQIQAMNGASTAGVYQAPSFQMPAIGQAASVGGLDTTTLLIIGAVLLIFLMKR